MNGICIETDVLRADTRWQLARAAAEVLRTDRYRDPELARRYLGEALSMAAADAGGRAPSRIRLPGSLRDRAELARMIADLIAVGSIGDRASVASRVSEVSESLSPGDRRG